MSTEVEETLKRLVQHKAVIGTIVVNCEGIPIKSTLDNHTTTQYSGLINQLVDQAKVRLEIFITQTCILYQNRIMLRLTSECLLYFQTMFKEIDPSNDLTFMRLRTRKHEIMVAPDRDYLLIVVQNTMEV